MVNSATELLFHPWNYQNQQKQENSNILNTIILLLWEFVVNHGCKHFNHLTFPLILCFCGAGWFEMSFWSQFKHRLYLFWHVFTWPERVTWAISFGSPSGTTTLVKLGMVIGGWQGLWAKIRFLVIFLSYSIQIPMTHHSFLFYLFCQTLVSSRSALHLHSYTSLCTSIISCPVIHSALPFKCPNILLLPLPLIFCLPSSPLHLSLPSSFNFFIISIYSFLLLLFLVHFCPFLSLESISCL